MVELALDIADFACPCCGQIDMHPAFLVGLETAQVMGGRRFRVSVGKRCTAENRRVVGSKLGSHIDGRAAHIATEGPWERAKILNALIKAGFRRLGIAPKYIHVERTEAPPAVWLIND